MAVTGKAEPLSSLRAVLYAILTFGTLGVLLVTTCHDRFPLREQHACSPCECGNDMVLTGCPIPSELKDPFLFLVSLQTLIKMSLKKKENKILTARFMYTSISD